MVEQREMRPRNSCKAIIIENGKLLTLQKRNEEDIDFVLPGGGQRHGETFINAVKRECVEELGVEPTEIGTLVFIREYIGINHDFPKNHKHVHKIEYMFHCKIQSNELGNGTEIDKGQEGIKWINVKDLNQYNFYPRKLIPEIIKYVDGKETKVYLGDIN